ncbi:YeeE/YedE family protein [Streptomyces sp. S07_1.15]|uniref:YeeE/YedE family protein n=1 Tax=Streptomyces sp. S07_1.15 TaxID=2873925 RepID=UPI001D14033E|nr:YeeE/YedE thiosulfate transporter family protein [Streptomyces sp. S07_1.15]MCC3652956.1 YeeE/YedE family protein [Streptomyces sp. S07_1.15]
MSPYWPWWAGAVGLALVTIVHTLTTDRSLGVSSAWDRVLHWRSERELERLDEEFTDEQAFADALAAATAEHFGPAAGAPAAPQHFPGQHSPAQYSQAQYSHAQYSHAQFAEEQYPPAQYPQEQYPPVQYTRDDAPAPAAEPGPATAGSTPVAAPRPAPVVTQAALLVSILLGGWIAAYTSGRFELRFDMGAGFESLVTADPLIMTAVLFAGGILVGFGTRLAGGCSSGHGLSGCGRLRPVSLVATAVFFGTAVAVSFLLWKVI